MSEKQEPIVGNVAAMREVLEHCRNCAMMIPQFVQVPKPKRSSLNAAADYADIILREVDAALAAPPRNCDRFGGDNAKLQKVYYSECGKEYEPKDPYSRQAYLVGYGNWLLAPAKDKEGRNDANK